MRLDSMLTVSVLVSGYNCRSARSISLPVFLRIAHLLAMNGVR